MKWLVVVSAFLYDLIIGDSWPLTAVVALILGVGVVVSRLDAVAPGVLVSGLAAGLFLGAPAVILIEVKRHLRSGAKRARGG